MPSGEADRTEGDEGSGPPPEAASSTSPAAVLAAAGISAGRSEKFAATIREPAR
jgi:hypothetical protein